MAVFRQGRDSDKNVNCLNPKCFSTQPYHIQSLQSYFILIYTRESVDSPCRDGTDTVVHVENLKGI